jgi:(4-(4-[2-(gamma-L-glutamylamino)ethyl]phenoxymethyl)furan-2-yl)methanamine synthase
MRTIERRSTGPARVIGWDVGGAHLKACLLENGAVVDVAQWACPLWQGLQHLNAALAQARQRWPQALNSPQAVTMTGEMTDLFVDREDGVQRITDALQSALPGPVRVYAGPADAQAGALCAWAAPHEAGPRWQQIASANWLATAQHAAAVAGSGILIDIGSTTTDLIAFKDGRVVSTSRSDRDRLASGELVYQGVVRTPLCALSRRIALQGQTLNVMNEFFATTADVYRLTGELDPAHDLYPAADNAAKTPVATRQRLARMVGCDVRDASDAEWLAFARQWRQAQLAAIGASLDRVLNALPPPAEAAPALAPATSGGSPASVVSAGCGAFLVPELLRASSGWPAAAPPVLRYGHDIARIAAGPADAEVAGWAQVCAPSVAVAALYDREHR